MANKSIRIDYSIGPVSNQMEIAGSYYFNVPNEEPRFIIRVLKQSLNKLQIDKHNIITGILQVFIDNKNKYEVGFFKIGSLCKTHVKKL